MKLIMRRNGHFICNWNSSDGKCGADKVLNPEYFYDCLIEAEDILDKNGFLIDQLEIDKYFQQKYSGHRIIHPAQGHRPHSCELIAINAVNDIKYLVESHMHQARGVSMIYKISVSVGFNSQAVMTAEWTPEKARADGRTSKSRTQV